MVKSILVSVLLAVFALSDGLVVLKKAGQPVVGKVGFKLPASEGAKESRLAVELSYGESRQRRAAATTTLSCGLGNNTLLEINPVRMNRFIICS